MMRLNTQEISAVRDALRSSHRQLATYAKTIPTAERTRRSYCTEWTVAHVYSHLGAAAEIGLVNLRAALAGTKPADTRKIWKQWDSLTADQMISGFEVADNQYLDALDRLDIGDADDDVVVQIDTLLQLPIDLVLVLRLAEHALHSWDVYVAFDSNVEVDSHAADLLVDLYPRELVSMFATRLVAGRVRQASLRIDIGSSPRTLVMTFANTVSLETADPADEPACTGHLRLPTSGAWVRLLTGRLDDDHLPSDVTSTGTPTLHELRILLQGDPLSTGDAASSL